MCMPLVRSDTVAIDAERNHLHAVGVSIVVHEKEASPLASHMRTHTQGRIQKFILGGPNQGPQSKVEGEARIEGAKRPSIEGEARVESAKRPRIEGEARTEGEAREKSGERGLGRGLGEPLPRKFSKNQT